MMKVRILDRCEYCDGEVSMREVRRLTAIDLARCVMAVAIGPSG
jgi:phage FluMu protein gp41